MATCTDRHFLAALLLAAAGALLCDGATAQPSSSRFDRVLAGVADEATLKARVEFSQGITLAAFHQMSQRLGVPFAEFAVGIPSQSTAGKYRFLVFAQTGSWYEVEADDWQRMLCDIKMSITEPGVRDAPESALFVPFAQVTAPAKVIRSMLSNNITAASLDFLERLDERNYAHAKRNAEMEKAWRLDRRFVPVNYVAPVGCEIYVRRLAGWRGTQAAGIEEIPRDAARGVLEALMNDIPHQPVELGLLVAESVPIESIAALVESYQVARMRVDVTFRDLESRSVQFLDFEFGSKGMLLVEQIEQAACRHRAQRPDLFASEPSGPSLKMRSTPSTLTVSVRMRVNEASRLAAELPFPVLGVTIREFLYAKALDSWDKRSASYVAPKAIEVHDEIPKGCERFLVKSSQANTP